MIDFSHTRDARPTGRTGMCGVPRPTGFIRVGIGPN